MLEVVDVICAGKVVRCNLCPLAPDLEDFSDDPIWIDDDGTVYCEGKTPEELEAFLAQHKECGK